MSDVVVEESTLRPMSVRVPGHKHAAVCALAAAIASGCRLGLDNAPDIEDVRVLKRALTELGGEVEDNEGLVVDPRGMRSSVVSPQLSARIHGSIYLVPALLARLGTVRFSRAGGCLIGRNEAGFFRPTAHIFSVLEKFGATFEQQGEEIVGRASPLRACEVDLFEYSESREYFLGPNCTGAMKAAILAALGTERGTTRIRNPIRRPEINTLLDIVKALGVAVNEEPGCIEITGLASREGTRYRIMSDLSALITYMACAAYHQVPLRAGNLTPDPVKSWLASEFDVLAAMGVHLRWSGADVELTADEAFAPIALDIMPEGLATDHQPFFALLALRARGESSVRDRVWPDRFQYAAELRRLGAQIEDIPQGIVIRPGRPMRSGVTVAGADLRAAAVLLIAALAVPGFTRVGGLHHLERGYEDLIGNLQRHGARFGSAPMPVRAPAGDTAESAARVSS
jgi:UDP-N-acetylglucosamine 1-carboxyvinyltransferase